MDIVLKTEKSPEQKRAAAKRTAWILGAIAAAFFIWSIVQQLVIVHRH